MTKAARRTIERLGAMSYGVLVLMLLNVAIEHDVSFTIRTSLPVAILLVTGQLVMMVVSLYCLFFFLSHLFAGNKRVSWAGKTVWLFLLLFGCLVTMPIYWYVYLVRERLLEPLGDASRLVEMALPITTQPDQPLQPISGCGEDAAHS
jgi:hypothetical protein